MNTEFLEWLNSKYGKHGEVKATRGKLHDYLGMNFDLSTPGKVIVDQIPYVQKILDECPFDIKQLSQQQYPARKDLMHPSSGKPLPKGMADEYHTQVAKVLYLCKRARPDIHTAVASMCTRTQNPHESDWMHLEYLFQYLHNTQHEKLHLSVDALNVVKWFVDASFAVHPDYRSHTGGNMTLGKGSVISVSRKQKLNTRSACESELVGTDDTSVVILWTKLFMGAQGYDLDQNILYQDNKGAIQMENNGTKSSSKRTRHLNIRYFFIHDRIKKGDLSVEYCPTGDMVADFFTKPLQGELFHKFKAQIMGHG